MTGTKAICAKCTTPLAPEEGGQTFYCPTCGISGTVVEVRDEVQSHINEMHARMLQRKVEEIGKAHPWTNPTISPLPDVPRRFISDLTPENYAERTKGE